MMLALCKQLQEKQHKCWVKSLRARQLLGLGKGFLCLKKNPLMFCLKFESKIGCQNCPQVVGVPLLKWQWMVCFAVENIAGVGWGGGDSR